MGLARRPRQVTDARTRVTPNARRFGAAGVATAALVLALAACTPIEPHPTPDVAIDLLQQDWRNVPGISADDSGLSVTSTGRQIVDQDGGGGRPDPPVDLAGTHLVSDGDFVISATIENATADATLAIYDSPPVIADEFRIEPPGLRLTLRGDQLQVDVLDGSPQDTQPAQTETVPLSDPEAELGVSRTGDRIEISSAGDVVVSLLHAAVFDSGTLWLGLSSADGSFTVSSFTAAASAGASLTTAGPIAAHAERSSNGLQTLASRARPGFLVGAAAALGPLAADADYAGALIRDFGAVTPENAMKPQALSPRQGEYTFEEADALLDLAESKGIAVHGHTIAFSEAMPSWMRDLPADTEQERLDSGAILLDYVTTVVTHFAGRLHSLDVVNEPFDVDQSTRLQQNIWYRVFGPAYPVVVSQAVHDADPAVLQFINENGADVPGERQDALRELALETNRQGGHIAGVGLQSHVYDLDTDAISAEDLETTLEAFGDAGLTVRISENDVPDSEGERVQADQFATILRTCIRSVTCVSYTTWGVDDRYDWFLGDDGTPEQGHDLLFDDGEPTPAYQALRDVLDG
ncbi:endo-1,4-beta-xylanase [Herbiconiux sp. CPCC 205716]|uniref:endo-1,4-beta-xylanase n=1 Tax=Herbiconiux gentiana TaxID=2970912 RepID=A0ABT2GIU8_9MICO|nr:endo-1,4-beta-xylanase [Herbiconiux gentiana]MCS5716154.1 endo-1,4-beta-xylanase [Herbiconiux gentiana]